MSARKATALATVLEAPVSTDTTLVDATPTADAWGAYFEANPNDLARLVELDVADGHAALTAPPTGKRTTARGWAHWFADRPELLIPYREDRERRAVERAALVGPDGRVPARVY